jgi:hypothetical protein
MDTLITLNILLSLAIAAAAMAVWLPHQIHEGLVTKIGLGAVSTFLVFGAMAMANDPSPYMPLMLCWAGVQLGVLVAAAGFLWRLWHSVEILEALRVASGWTPLDDQPLADQ